MSKTTKSVNQENKSIQKRSSKRLTAKQIVHRHIKNEDDIITDEDLENVKIENCVPGEIKKIISSTVNEEDHAKDESKDHPIITSWDVLKE